MIAQICKAALSKRPQPPPNGRHDNGGFGRYQANAPFRADLAVEKDRQNRARAGKFALIGTGALAFIALVLGVFYIIFFGDMPSVTSAEQIWTANREPSLEIVSKDGTTLAYRGPRYGRRVSVDDIPAPVLRAFLAVEDARFFEHSGVDFWSIGRAMVENLIAGHTVQGGSTITQQLVKNVYLSPDQTLKRKLQEMALAWQIDQKFSKKEILEIYLNRIYFGQNAYGLDAASWVYFSKRPWELTLPEAASLAGLPKAPGRLSQNLNSPAAITRRHVVLSRMVAAGFITPQLAAQAGAAPLTLTRTPDPPEGEMAYAIDMVAAELAEKGNAISPDRVVRITIDPAMEQAAVEALQSVLDGAGKSMGANQAALVAMDRQGRILAMVGGRSYQESQFNRATQARRQPGSTFKPFVYAAALESGLTPNTIRVDRPVRFGGWSPHNFSNGYYGTMTLNSALTRSINTIAVQLAAEIGVDKVRQVAQRLGISSPLPRNLTIALGSADVTLLEMTRAYGTLANDGVRIDPFLVEQVDNSRGSVAFRRRTDRPVQVYEPLKARQMTAMLANVVHFGTAQSAQMADGREIAAKTGTSQNFRDAWFMGYSADIICGVWVGNDNGRPMYRVTGGTVPAMIWRRFMSAAHMGKPLTPLPTLDDLARPSDQTIASFYDSLADMLAAASGSNLAPVAIRRADRAQPVRPTVTAPPTVAPATTAPK